MKKLIPVLLAFVMMLAMTGTALAATVYTEGALNYTIADESITITGYFGKDAEVTIPASIAGIPVNTIAKGAFTDNSSVRKVNLPDTITTVEEGAFVAGITVNYNSNLNGGDKMDDNKQDDNKSDDNKSDDNKPADNKPDGSKSDDNHSGSGSGGSGNGAAAGIADGVNGTGGNAAANGTSGNNAGTNGGALNSGIDEGEVFADDMTGDESESSRSDAADQIDKSDQTDTSEETAASDQAAAPQQSTGHNWIWVMLGVIAAAAVCVVIIVVMRKKKK